MAFNYHREALSRFSGQSTNTFDALARVQRRANANLSLQQRLGKSAFKMYNKSVWGTTAGLGRGIKSAFGGGLMAGAGLGMAAGLGLSAFTHDPTKNSFASHMAQEGLKTGVDAGFDALLWSTVGRLGVPGKVVAGAFSLASFVGQGPYAAVESTLEDAGKAYKKKLGMGPGPITKNERTMRSMQRNLSLLGQSGRRHSMLGSEAQYMHN